MMFYMLFYRRKQAPRPQEASGNPAYKVPAKLLCDICVENDELDKLREEFDKLVNEVTLQIHFEPNYRYKDGALKIREGIGSFSEIKFDRRKSIAELMVLIREVGDGLVPDNMTVHRMREVPAGFHVYDCVSDEAEKPLMSVNVNSNSLLFVWDGEKVDGSSIPTGDECEPIYLTIIYGNPLQYSCGFPKNITFADLKAAICDLTGVAMPDLSLTKLVESRGTTSTKSLNKEDLTLPIGVMDFRNGDQIVAEDRHKQDVQLTKTVADKQKQFFVVVENRCAQMENDDNWRKSQIEVTSETSVAEIKGMAISSFGLGDILDGGRLRIDGHKTPLHEQQTTEEALLTQGCCLLLEPGQAPLSNQMTLTFTPGEAKSDLPDLEILVEKNMTVSDCVAAMIQLAGFTGSNWHLRKTNWCGEAAEVLDDLDLTMSQALVSDGDHLLLLEGRLPPKGYLRLPIYLYPTMENPQHSSTDQTGMLAWITQSIQGLMSPSSSSTSVNKSFEPVQVGEMEISKDATLEDLKLQILTLPALVDMPIPTPNFLRVRLLESHRLGTILRVTTQTLRRLKVTSASRIAVQIMTQEESLGTNEVVLQVKQRIPDTKMYGPEQEFVWDMSRGGQARDLTQCLADLCLLPVEQVVIAKHFLQRFEWLVIEEPKNPQTKQKGKKKGGGNKGSLKQAPYHLQDGDVIGIKNSQLDPGRHDDFSTEEDVLGREEVKRAAEEKKKMREERRKAYGDGPKTRRPEVALTIKVDSFT